MADSTPGLRPNSTLFPRVPLLIGGVAAALAVVIPLLPPHVRPWNFAAFGAIAVFVAARGGRFGVPVSLGLVFAAKLVCDLLLYVQHGSDPRYLPDPVIYAAMVPYALFAGLFVRRAVSPIVAGLSAEAAAGAGSLAFFLVTNHPALQTHTAYSPGLAGVTESYTAGLEFLRPTLLSDLGFTATLFLLNAVLAGATTAAGRGTPMPIHVRDNPQGYRS